MSENEIKPAMTPEEWANAISRDNTEDRVGTDRERFAVYWLEGGGEYESGAGGASHGAAAMLLHGQSYGFTWEDVDALRDAATEWQTTSNPRGNEALLSAADRIAALLPPRERKP